MLWILDPYQVYHFADIFYHFVGCLFTFLLVFINAQNFKIFVKYSLFLLLVLLVSHLRHRCQIQGHEDLPLCFLLRVLWL